MNLTEPPFVPPGLLRLDAVTDDERRVVVRVRSAAALGLPLCPWTFDDHGLSEWGIELGDGSSFPDPFFGPVHAVSSDTAVTTLTTTDDRGFTSTSGPGRVDPEIGLLPARPVVGGSPLVRAHGSDAVVGWVPGFGPGPGSRTWAVSADPAVLPDGSWRVTGPAAARDDQALADLLSSTGDFVHPHDYLDSLAPGAIPGEAPPTPTTVEELLARGRALLEPGRAALAALLDSGTPPEPIGVSLGGSADPNGTVALDLMAWVGAVSGDPAAASLLGTYAVLPDSAGLLLHTLTASTSFVVPAPFPDAPPALQLAWALAENGGEQAALGRHLADQHPGLVALAEALPDTHRVVHLQVPAIVARMPLPPRPPQLVTVAGGVAVSGHQGGPITLRRFDRAGEHRVRFLLLPASGEVVEPPDVLPPGSVLHEAHTQDLWGQWSGPGSSPPAERPVPATAPPTVVLEVEPADPTSLPGSAPASPGRLVVRAFTSSPPTFGAAISSMTVALGGTSALHATLHVDPDFAATHPAGAGRWWVARSAVLPVEPGGSIHVSALVTAHAGAATLTGELHRLRVVDPRPVAVEVSSPVLLFAGAAGPDPNDGRAEVDLLVPRPAVPDATRFRLYAADEAALTGSSGSGPRHTRVAALLAAARSADRSQFVRLPDDAIRPLPTGDLRVRAPLPGRSIALRVLRLAAVSAGGIEAPPARCGAFVVAAPLDDAPGRPTVAVRRTTTRTLRATVTLTHPRPAGETAPAPFALRGTPSVTPVPAEVWWGPDGAGAGPGQGLRAGVTSLAVDTTSDETPWRWSGELDLTLPPGAPPWLPLRLWARVAWPAEPSWVVGTTPAPGTVHQRWGDVDARPSRWSDWSAGVSATPAEEQIDATLVASGPMTTQLLLPTLAPGSPPWQVVASSPLWRPVRLTTAGGVTDLDLPPLLEADAEWSITVSSPDGSLGRVVGSVWVPGAPVVIIHTDE